MGIGMAASTGERPIGGERDIVEEPSSLLDKGRSRIGGEDDSIPFDRFVEGVPEIHNGQGQIASVIHIGNILDDEESARHGADRNAIPHHAGQRIDNEQHVGRSCRDQDPPPIRSCYHIWNRTSGNRLTRCIFVQWEVYAMKRGPSGDAGSLPNQSIENRVPVEFLRPVFEIEVVGHRNPQASIEIGGQSIR